VIVAVAATLRAALRADHFVARYGGEEFVLLLPGLRSTEAEQDLERLRAALESVPVAHANQLITVTGSFGLAEFHPGDPAERVFMRADAALYRAKSGGRNRVCVYADDQAAPT
jgi:diguanylate cyclase